ncbi:G2/M phase-specific E3 ubiquitin-protein ligase [Nilaparvata lugens]|uniref:G2/M phase-specific E3 ubiquitin-protein ligase n=1 Tax=Nilaparvata lugens TaxID=108931 RepID=UPI00193E7AB0|nr:G2/M phase-specific E3 ubiquitin-protein ligase [Nilaparvata lugens]XP_022187297.2 G2/M phase-specific E3 ubiquitin-protein ligase [Nilaparvata lugens]XP_022187298.2 G2/M phase-specific E3 ubiquitin-protein ligase [Nilaparvata lugens]XP_039289001.1 G2/M phase-specific E3 ubiquitin-protein ligase [Nilaparvata lugens]
MAETAIKLNKFSRNKRCTLCKGREADEITYGSVYRLGKVEVHYFCLLLSSCVAQKGEDEEGILGFLQDDILKAANLLSKVQCTFCNGAGANVRCQTARCKVVFHYPCGVKNNCSHKFLGQFPSYCPKHRVTQKIPKQVFDIIKGVQLECVVCLDNVELNDNTIWAPCCKKNAFFHKRCLQGLAFSFGSYALKCPLCNNQQKFSKALVDNGIFIPEQDASWETEPRAFRELLERYSRCDAVKCVCRRGRDFTDNNINSMWQILLCSLCGSQGIHRKCLMSRTKSRWECDTCQSAERTEDRPPQVATPITAPDPDLADDASTDSNIEVIDCDGYEPASVTPCLEQRIPEVPENTSTFITPDRHHQQSNLNEQRIPEVPENTSTFIIPDRHHQQSNLNDDNDSNNEDSDYQIISIERRNNEDRDCQNISIERRSLKRKRSSDESFHSEKVFASNFNVAKVEEQASSSSQSEDSIIKDLKEMKPFESCPIIIDDSDDEGANIISIDSDDDDDDVIEVTDNFTPISLTEVMRNSENNNSPRVVGKIGSSLVTFIPSPAKTSTPTSESASTSASTSTSLNTY